MPPAALPGLVRSWAFEQMLKYFSFEHFHETGDEELQEMHKAGRRFIVGAQPHGSHQPLPTGAPGVPRLPVPESVGPHHRY